MSAAKLDEKAFPELLSRMSNRLHLYLLARFAQLAQMRLEHVAARVQTRLRCVQNWSLGHCNDDLQLLHASTNHKQPPEHKEHTLCPNGASSCFFFKSHEFESSAARPN